MSLDPDYEHDDKYDRFVKISPRVEFPKKGSGALSPHESKSLL
jgi:hypothetical protein